MVIAVGETQRRWAVAMATTVLAGATIYCGPAVSAIRTVRARMFPGLSGVGDEGHVALTFDDGPDPVSTPRFLDLLEKLDVRATFFVLGDQLARHKWIGRSMAAAGHEVAVHGWSHTPAISYTVARVRRDLSRTSDLIAETTGARPQWFRPPYGFLSTPALIAARQTGLVPVLWGSWAKDWQASATPSSVVSTIARCGETGTTVLLHDRTASASAWRASLAALPTLVTRWRERGLRVGPLNEHGIRRGAEAR
jgi:peptidoglycan-N-acetylglucosamine deacetylase